VNAVVRPVNSIWGGVSTLDLMLGIISRDCGAETAIRAAVHLIYSTLRTGQHSLFCATTPLSALLAA